MAAVWMRFRADLRARWAALLALVLLVGLAGGASLAAFAGARRTDTAFGRLAAATGERDVLVNPDNGTSSVLDDARVASLPHVVEAGRVDGLLAVPPDVRRPEDLGALGIVLVSDGTAGYRFARPRMSAGRMPRPDRPDEVWIDLDTARAEGLRVGDRFPVVVLGNADIAAVDSGSEPIDALLSAIRGGEVGTRVPARVVGIGEFPEDIVVDEGFEARGVVFGPGLTRRHPDLAVSYWAELVRLRHGSADLPAFRRDVEALAPGEAVAFQTLATTTTKVDRAVRPAAGALRVFALVVALTGLLVVGQAIARQTVLDGTDNGVYRALGATRRDLVGAAMLRAVVVAVAGAAVGMAVAVLASPLTPIGVARAIEPDPGFRIDGSVLALGASAIVASVLALAALPAWRAARIGADAAVATRPSRVAGLAADTGLPVPVATGVRMALEPGRGRTAVPVRTTIVSAGLAVATVVAAAVFAASLAHLVGTPRLFGWNWDTQVSVSADSEEHTTTARDGVRAVFDASPAVARWGTVSLSDVTIAGRSIPTVGLDVRRGAAVPTLVAGRLPARDDELALGRLTARRLGVATGDRVQARDVDGNPVRLKVVGAVVLPGFGTYQGSDKTSLGEGAVVTQGALARLAPAFGRDDFVVQFASSATPRQRHAVLTRAASAAGLQDPSGFVAGGVERPSDIVAYDRVRTVPLVLALVLAVLAFATIAHALVSAVRRRRRDLAMLSTLGLTRRQISSTVAWQATTVGVCALLIGIPLGVIGGRWAWRLLAEDLGTVSEPRVPVAVLAVFIVVTLVLCNAVAYVPGRLAARIRPAVVLRSE